MALPANLKQAPTPQELEYITGEIIVAIEPLFRMEKVRLVSGVYGPFRPPAKTRVPLWLAQSLKLKRKCRIVPPDWVTVDFLTLRLQQETSQSELSKMPFRYAEVAKVLLDIASDDIMEPDKIRILLKDIREARQAKSRQLLLALDAPYTTTENLCSMEICEMRLFFSSAMGIISKLDVEAPAQDEEMYDF
ncbi:related to PSF2-part of GINS, replication multiprotein complex [Serendipita indica DSM 11827]|uniref:DNA replication complex GINS protein PSF2 n=1 Tax=Serendipita indica (strain DSM 11827) TaxID=1109443 RepID=G4T5J1_SERID|nr:related to PSF2-part of GINS, replication multiprotein complex [Serendipita indica DSM 11827]